MSDEKRSNHDNHNHRLVKVPGYAGLYTATGFIPDPKKEAKIQQLIREEAERIKAVASRTDWS